MRFWDTSAILPIVVAESTSPQVDILLAEDERVIIWWGTAVECYSGMQRRLRDGSLTPDDYQIAIAQLDCVLDDAFEVHPTFQIRRSAQRLLTVHQLRGADALQLAAALSWAGTSVRGRGFVTFDTRLRVAAQLEGFSLYPS